MIGVCPENLPTKNVCTFFLDEKAPFDSSGQAPKK
jgi:hypothetical protein